MPSSYKSVNNLKISEDLLSFVNNELLKDTDIIPEKFWFEFDEIVHSLAPKNKELIETRENLQKKIDDWHIKNRGDQIEIGEYKNFLKKIGFFIGTFRTAKPGNRSPPIFRLERIQTICCGVKRFVPTGFAKKLRPVGRIHVQTFRGRISAPEQWLC